MKKMKKVKFKIFPILFAIVLVSTFISSCDDDDDNGGGQTTELTITTIDPTTARIGETIAINGTGFSTDRTLNTVSFSTSATAPVSAVVASATASQLTVEVPEGAGNGPITVTVGNESAVSPQQFTLNTSLGAPELSGIDPTNGYMGTEVTITGSNFGEDATLVHVYFNAVEAEITSLRTVSEMTQRYDEIKATVPEGLEVGDAVVKVVRDDMESTNTLTYTVNKTPTSVKTVYWASDGIYKGIINESGADISQLYANAGDDSKGIEVDTEAGYIYWGTTSGKIQKAPVNGDSPVETLYEDLGYILDIAIDATSQKIFIISSDNVSYTNEYIQSADLNGSGTVENLYSQPQSDRAGYYSVKLVVADNKLYWTESGKYGKKVMEGSINGSSEAVATILFDENDGLNAPVGIAVDAANNKIYIVDKGASSGTPASTVYSGSLDGQGSLSILVAPGDNVSTPSDAEIDLDNGYLFWMNNSGYEDTGEIMRAKLDGTEVETLFGGIDFGSFFDLDIH